MKNYKVAIVGATGVVGNTVLKVLEEKSLPISTYTFFASHRSAGKKIEFMRQQYEIQELNDDSFNEGFDYAIFCAGSEVSSKYVPIAVAKNCIVIDNSSFFRMDSSVPLIVPEVNFLDIKNHHGIISNPNCSTIQAAVALKPLDDRYKIKRIVCSTYQAVSGAGSKGLHDLENGILNYMDNRDITETIYLKKFPHPIFSNCVPQIDSFEKNGYTKEELKFINETRKILHNPNLNITVTAVRVPVLNCHSESINIEFEKDFDLKAIYDTLRQSPGIIIQDNISTNMYPLAIKVSNKDDVFVGRVRRDFSVKSGINLWVVADNLRKGAATNAVQILEKLILNK